jgi:hypothetical protein
MGLKRCLVAVNFEEVIDIAVLLILQDIEPSAAGFITLGTESIGFDRREEPLAFLWLDPNLDPNCQHKLLPISKSSGTPRARPLVLEHPSVRGLSGRR